MNKQLLFCLASDYYTATLDPYNVPNIYQHSTLRPYRVRYTSVRQNRNRTNTLRYLTVHNTLSKCILRAVMMSFEYFTPSPQRCKYLIHFRRYFISTDLTCCASSLWLARCGFKLNLISRLSMSPWWWITRLLLNTIKPIFTIIRDQNAIAQSAVRSFEQRSEVLNK